MNITFIQNSQHNIHRDQGRQDQERLIAQGRLKSLGRALELAADTAGQSHVLCR